MGLGVSRRRFLAMGGAGAAAWAVTPTTYARATATTTPTAVDRGTPTQYTGAALARIGMPIGGACAGQVYLAGDGRLWNWDIFNPPGPPLGGNDHGGSHYANPVTADSNKPFKQAFAIRTTANGTTKTRTLDSAGFNDVTFVGQYPIGRVQYRATDSPVDVTLEAFSPFNPLHTDDSSLPATILAYTVRNTSTTSTEVTVLGVSENPACVTSRKEQPTTLRATTSTGTNLKGVQFDASLPTQEQRPDVVFEDWERATYDAWTATGTAFGDGPVDKATLPDYMKRFGDLGVTGNRFVTSHNFRASPNDIGAADAHQGTLTSAPFTVQRKYVALAISGGNHPGQTCVEVQVDGATVAQATGADGELLATKVLDLTAHQGKQARIRIVDTFAGPWGHVNVDRIVFSDRADILFEDWENDTYAGWTKTGNAFGDGPVQPFAVPAMMRRFGDLNVNGTRFATSFNFRAGGDADSYTGTLTSAAFTITRKYVAVGIGGGNRPGVECVNVLVGGQVVATATGANSEPMVPRMLDVSAYEGRTAQIQVVDNAAGAWGHLSVDRILFTDAPDILFEDWERTNFSGWTITGNAFGASPVTPAETPEGFRRPFGEINDLNISGARFATSFNFRAGGNADSYTGTLTSPVFTIQRRFATVWIGGGRNPGQSGVEVVVAGQVVASATGSEIEPMQAVSLDVSAWLGQQAQIRIADRSTGAWGHLNVDRIILSDRPIRQQQIADRPDGGSFVLAALDETAVVRPSIADWSTTAAWFDSGAGPGEVPGSSAGQAGAVTVRATLAPGEAKTFRFVLGWHFPTPERRLFAQLVGVAALRRHYATRFATAGDVAKYVATNATRLEAGTRAWVKAWYEDSSLPHWFCERTLATASTLATNTCYRWQDGRFYAFEGSYLYAGTCGHVWNYAQAVGRLFPDLERDTRERVDLGIALRPTGEIGNRGECADDASSFVDGQAGTILRVYREHQMTADNTFLTRVWPKVRTALEFLVTQRDVDGNGILQGAQWNTLDTPFTGDVPWLSGLYVAALRAGAAMATEQGDTASAQRYASLANAGTQFISTTLWNAQAGYFIQRVGALATNTNRGCFIDQTYGQTFAAQVGLPRVLPADKTKFALASVVRNNHLPSPRDSQSPAIPGGRVYSTSGEAGTMMCTWPIGGDTEARSGGYFNEVWTGQEYQLAAGLFADGLVTEALAVTRSVYDRYHASKRNPYNEVEAGDHYSRAMMSYGTYVAACGYEYHGPKGHLGFAPRVGPEDFRGAFTAARGWGLYRQTRAAAEQVGVVDVRDGEVRVVTLAFETTVPATGVSVTLAGSPRTATVAVTGTRAVVTLSAPAVVQAGQSLEVSLRLA